MIHPTAEVSAHATIGQGTKVWHQAQVCHDAQIGQNCIIGKGVYIDFGVVIGCNVKIQNGAYIYHGVTIEDGVFVGPQVCFTNDMFPRAITPSGALKTAADWQVGRTLVRAGASLGAGAIILPNLVIGQFAMVAAGAVVTRDVPDHGLVLGNPARLIGFVCHCGWRLRERERQADMLVMECSHCGSELRLTHPGV
jgi:acetyltransferase-like isoleucine patch superfamily enzyme